MDSHMHLDRSISNNEPTTSPVLSHSEVITPTKPKAGGLLADLAGCSSSSDKPALAPGIEDSGARHQLGNLARCADPSFPLFGF